MDPTATQQAAAFFDGGKLFNAVVFWLTFSGVALGIVALGIVIVQLRKIRKATNASRDASVSTRNRMAGIAATVDFRQLGELAKEALLYLDTESVDRAAIRISDLRCGIAQGRRTPGMKGLMTQDRWQDMITDIAFIQAALDQKDAADGTIDQCKERLQVRYDEICGLAARAEARQGETRNAK